VLQQPYILFNTFVVGILTSIILLSLNVYNFEKTDPCLGGTLNACWGFCLNFNILFCSGILFINSGKSSCLGGFLGHLLHRVLLPRICFDAINCPVVV
jgi:hypothetical protein